MSEAKRQLEKMGRELVHLLDDLEEADLPWMPGPPMRTMMAPRSVGRETEVSVLVFVEHLAFLWVDWAGLLRRWQRYNGLAENEMPRRWRRLYERARDSVGRLLDDISIRTEMQFAWQVDWAGRQLEVRSFDGPRAALHSILEADARLRLVQRMRRQPNWGEIDVAARQFEEQVRGALERSSVDVQEAVQWHLGHYRHALLRLSWLEATEEWQGSDGSRLLRSEPMELNWLTGLNELELDPDTRGMLQGILRRVASTVFELGYDAFVEDLRSGEVRAGRDSVIGGEINLIPGKGKGVCHRILMAVASGKSRKALPGLPRVLREIAAHLVTCSPTLDGQPPNREATRIVVLLCDTWDSKQFQDEHRTLFLAHRSKGVRFIFLQVGSDGKTLSLIERDLA